MAFLTIAQLAVLTALSSGPQHANMDKLAAALPSQPTAVVVLKGGADDPPGDDRGRGGRGGRGGGGADDPPGDDRGGRRGGRLGAIGVSRIGVVGNVGFRGGADDPPGDDRGRGGRGGRGGGGADDPPGDDRGGRRGGR